MTTEEMAERIVETESRSKSNVHRLDKLEKWQEEQTELIKSVATIAANQESMSKEQERMGADIRGMRSDLGKIIEKPAKRWDSIIDKALLAAVGALVLYIMAKLGLA